MTTGLLLLLLLLLYVHCFVGFSISRKANSMIRSILYRNGFRMLGHFKHVLKISLNFHPTLNLHTPEGQLGSPRGPFISLYTFMSCHVSVIHKYNNMKCTIITYFCDDFFLRTLLVARVTRASAKVNFEDHPRLHPFPQKPRRHRHCHRCVCTHTYRRAQRLLKR